MSETPHEWYGPCDMFGKDGACSVCEDIDRLAEIMRKMGAGEVRAAYRKAFGEKPGGGQS